MSGLGTVRSRGSQLTRLLEANELTVVPGVYDALSARVAEELGYEALVIGSYATNSCAFGLPDTGVVTVPELIDNARRIIRAVTIPIILDLDDCGGSPLKIRRNVALAADAGAAAIQIEDVDLSHGKHFKDKPHEVLPLEVAVDNLRAAIEARADSDMLIVARTDVLFTGSLDDAIERINAFAEVGAEIGMICLLPLDDMARATSAVTLPLLNTYLRDESRPDQIAEARAAGLRLIVPASLSFRAAYAAVRQALTDLRDNGQDPTMESWAQIAADVDNTIGLDEWATAVR
ncbi:MAG: oxaloacetate decarboxylase [Acidimicrobiia bacterium]